MRTIAQSVPVPDSFQRTKADPVVGSLWSCVESLLSTSAQASVVLVKLIWTIAIPLTTAMATSLVPQGVRRMANLPV